jgi:hypothetical protein
MTDAAAAFGAWLNNTPAPAPSAPIRNPLSVNATDADQAYAVATLNRLAGEVAMSAPGEINDTLNKKALRAYRVADARGLDRQVVTDVLKDAVRRAGGTDTVKDESTLRSARNGADKYGPAHTDPGDNETGHGRTDFGWPLDETAADGQPAQDDKDALDSAIRNRAAQIRIDRAAKELVDAEQRPKIEYPPVRSLTALLGQPCPPTRWRIEGVLPIEARIIVEAQYKAGKTTLTGNFTRSIVDREPFLGRFAIHKTAGAVAMIDDELSEHTVQDWLGRQGIRNTDAVADVVTLRGKLAAFNLFDDRCRATWAKRFRDIGCDYLILDCLRPILDAFGLDENRDAGLFLVKFDAMLEEAGIRDAMIIHHMGHQGERSRGDSRLLDWPDATWKLVRSDESPASERYFSAYGRDVSVPEGRLTFNESTRHLTYAPGSRGDAEAEAALSAVIELLSDPARNTEGGLSGRAIELSVTGEHTRTAVRAAIKCGVRRGLIRVEEGPRRSTLHSIAQPCGDCGRPLAAGQNGVHESCRDAIGGAA